MHDKEVQECTMTSLSMPMMSSCALGKYNAMCTFSGFHIVARAYANSVSLFPNTNKGKEVNANFIPRPSITSGKNCIQVKRLPVFPHQTRGRRYLIGWRSLNLQPTLAILAGVFKVPCVKILLGVSAGSFSRFA